jgi:hypothetical protein
VKRLSGHEEKTEEENGWLSVKHYSKTTVLNEKWRSSKVFWE